MAKVNWARGFFRAWMLLAVLWLMGGAFIGNWVVLAPSVSTKILNRSTAGSYHLYSTYGTDAGD